MKTSALFTSLLLMSLLGPWAMAAKAPNTSKASIRALKCATKLGLKCVVKESKSAVKSEPRIEDKSLHQLQMARSLYSLGQTAQAIEAYEKVSKKSSLWFRSVEERAWAKAKARRFNESLADVKTLGLPMFSHLRSPESFHVSAYVYHQICDFKKVFEVTDDFKVWAKVKIESLESMDSPAEASRWIESDGLLSKSPSDLSKLDKYPSDLFLQGKVIGQLKQKNVKGLARSLAKFAKHELGEIRSTIARLNLIEADIIQRLDLDQKLKVGERNWTGEHESVGTASLAFPYVEGEVWLDEVDALKAVTKSCPTVSKEARL